MIVYFIFRHILNIKMYLIIIFILQYSCGVKLNTFIHNTHPSIIETYIITLDFMHYHKLTYI